MLPAGISRAAESEEVLMRRATPPYRAGQVGSLLRPERLLRAREESAAGQLTYDEEVAKLRLIVDVARDVWGE